MSARASLVWNQRLLHGMLVREYLTHRQLIGRLCTAWFIFIWVLPLLGTPLAMNLVGLVLAVRIGTALGGTDVITGCEESIFTAPATNTQRYLVRLGCGAVLMAALLGGGLLAVAWDLPQCCWSLVVDSGMTQRWDPVPAQQWWCTAVAWMSEYLVTFAIASNARSATTARSASSLAGVLLGSIAGAGAFLSRHWATDQAVLLVAVLVSSASLLLVGIGLWSYRRKEPSSLVTVDRFWVIILTVAVVAVLAVLAVTMIRPATRVEVSLPVSPPAP